MQTLPKSLFLLFLLISSEVSCTLKHMHPSPTLYEINRGPGLPSLHVKRQSPGPPESDTSFRQNKDEFQTGPFNFAVSLPKAMEIFGLGCLWIRSLSESTEVPYFYPILLPPLFVLVLVIIFVPHQLVNFNNFLRDIESAIG